MTSDGPTLVVRGRVVDASDHPVARAAVEVVDLGRVVTADTDGRFQIELPLGPHRLQVRRLGFEPGAIDIYVHPLSAPEPVLRLVPRPVLAAPVVVSATRHPRLDRVEQPGTHDLGSLELQRQVGGFEDVMRTVQAQPGVGASSDFHGEFSVRGSAASSNSILLDGVEIPFPYHILGFNSVFNPGLLESATLITGGAPAEFGNLTGGVLALQSRGAAPSVERGAIGISYLSGQARFAMGDAERGVFASLRRSYQDQLLRLVGSSLGRIVPVFHDAFLRARWQVSNRHLVTVGLLNAGDGMSLPRPEISAVDLDFLSAEGSGTTLADQASLHDKLELANSMWVGTLYWRAVLGSSSYLETTLGDVPQDFRFSLQGDNHESVFIRARRTSLRQDLTWGLRNHRAKFGWQASRDDALRQVSAWAGILTLRESNTALNLVDLKERYEIDAARRRDLVTVYAQDEWQARERLVLGGGLRLEHDSWARETMVSPRLAAEWQATRRWTARATLGLYHDLRDEPMEVLPTANGAPLQAERSVEATMGGALAWRADLQGGGSVYAKRLDRLVYEVEPSLYASGGTGNVYGLETWLRWEPREQPFRAAFTYSWSRTRQEDPVAWRRQPDYRATNVDEFWSVGYEAPYSYRPAHDEPHRLGFQGAMRLGPWDFGMRYQLASGRPYTPVEWVATDPLDTKYGIVGPKGSARYPVYQRLDVRVMRTMQRGKIRYSLYADVLNATAAENVFQYRYDADYQVRYAVKMLPLLPTLGIEASF